MTYQHKKKKKKKIPAQIGIPIKIVARQNLDTQKYSEIQKFEPQKYSEPL